VEGIVSAEVLSEKKKPIRVTRMKAYILIMQCGFVFIKTL